MAQVPNDDFTTFHEKYSRYILEGYQAGAIRNNKISGIPREGFREAFAGGVGSRKPKIGIIGAGISGLYAAMILQDLGVEYEILEAQPSHIGGRLLTHHFGGSPNDYYDVGAMHFPNTYPMWRTFDLFHRLRFTGKYIWEKNKFEEIAKAEAKAGAKVEAKTVAKAVAKAGAKTEAKAGAKTDAKAGAKTDAKTDAKAGAKVEAKAEKKAEAKAPNKANQSNKDHVPSSSVKTNLDDVIEYRSDRADDRFHFNGDTVNRKRFDKNSTGAFESLIPCQPYTDRGVRYWLDAKVGYFMDELRRDFASGMKELREYESVSMRQFMRTTHPDLKHKFEEYMTRPGRHPRHQKYPGEQAYTDEVINWIETSSRDTTTYDSAIIEIVLDELDYHDAPAVSWKTIRGGAERIALSMAEKLRERAPEPKGYILQNKRVTKISPTDVRARGKGADNKLLVHVEGEAKPRAYDHVLSTVPLSALRLIDLDDCKLSRQLRESIRGLQYEASVKVAIRFTHRWWERQDYKHTSERVIITDRPSQMIVHPPYGRGPEDATVIASCSRSPDALRLGALVKGQGSLAEQRLVDLVLQDLAKIHNIPFDDLKSWQIGAHAYNWYDNEYTMGVSAFFGPGQFCKMYPEVTQPAGFMHLHFAGDTTSTNHRCLSGALDSSVRALEQIFYQEGRTDLINKLGNDWISTSEMTKDNLVAQLALGQDDGKTFRKLYGDGKNT